MVGHNFQHLVNIFEANSITVDTNLSPYEIYLLGEKGETVSVRKGKCWFGIIATTQKHLSRLKIVQQIRAVSIVPSHYWNYRVFSNKLYQRLARPFEC